VGDITIYQESDAFVFVLLQKRDVNTGLWVPESNAQNVTFEVFDPDGVSIGERAFGSGVEYVGVVGVDGEDWGKYRAMYHFPEPGVYEAQVRCTGQGGGQTASRDAIPVENL
jgi:hypothetical protein